MPHVTVLGAGYAGVHAATTARAAGADVTVVDPTGRHDLLPRLAGVAAGRRPAGDAWAPLEALTDATLVRDRAVRVDPDGPAVELASGGVLTTDAVVVTVGAESSLPPVPGLDPDSARTLRDAADALHLREVLPEARALVVVGAGATGVQLAAEAALAHPRLQVDLVEATGQVLGAFAPSLGDRARQVLAARGVRVLDDCTVAAADTDGIELDDGRRLDGVVVWATGVAADGHALLPDARTSEGRLLVDRHLRVHGRVLAAGDVAAHRDVFGEVTAPSAQIALQAGRAAGRNAALVARGRLPRRATLLDLGWVVDMGLRGVAEIGPLRLTAPLVDRLVPALHEVTDLRHLWQAGGAGAVLDHASGRHSPSAAAVRRAERPGLRAVG